MANSALAHCVVIAFAHRYNRSNFNLFSNQKSKHIRLGSKKKSVALNHSNNTIIYGSVSSIMICIFNGIILVFSLLYGGYNAVIWKLYKRTSWWLIFVTNCMKMYDITTWNWIFV